MYAYKKSSPRTPAFQETAAQESENVASPRRGSSLRHELQKLTSLFKRRESQAENAAKPDAQAAYRRPENLIASGSIGKVYQYGNDYVMKDYSGVIEPEWKGRLLQAKNNAAAFNRLYGAGSASVLLREAANPLQKAVSVKLKKIKGQSLASILASRDIALAEKVMERYVQGNIAMQLAKKLEIAGVDHNDINLGNILFDPETESFNLIDFDDSHFNPPGVPLNEFMVQELERKINYYFRTFMRSVNEQKQAAGQG